jgi:serine/threonine protein kinase
MDIWQWDKLLFIVMNFNEGGQLKTCLERRGNFEEYEVYRLILQMVSVLLYLKEKMITHRDLNLSNFMLSKQNDLSDI